MPLVSVIVPVYNAEDYLEKCISSITAQTFADLELILVDDGSPDKSGEICDALAKTDERIKVIHKQNAGVSAARNMGLQTASGDYVFFCDSDDTLPRDAIERLYIKIKDGYDMTTGYFEYVESNKKGNLVNTRRFIKTQAFEVKNDFGKEFDLCWRSVVFTSSCGKLFVRDIIEKNNIRFNKNLIVFEDFDFVLSYLEVTKSIFVIDSYVYSVFCEKSETSHHLRRSRLDYMEDYIKGDYKLKAFLKSRNMEYTEQYWRTIRANLQIAYDALWAMPAKTKQEKKAKLARISEVLKVPQVRHMIDYQEFIYSRAEYRLLKHGNAFALDRYYRFKAWMKKYFV